MKKYDVTALGELLIDFTSAGRSDAGMSLFEQNPGGAPANVLAALARLGKNTGFIGKVGHDMHGVFLRDTLAGCGIGTQGLVMDRTVFTTLAFVELDADGQRHFSFARKPGADTCLRADELWDEYLKETDIFHFGSLSLTGEPARSATLEAVRRAKKAGAVISYDPNYRPLLWPGPEAAGSAMQSVLDLVDFIKISDEETELLTGETDPVRAVERLLERGITVAAVTLGHKGALVGTAEGVKLVPGYAVEAVDTTGAGDSFWGGFLCRLLEAEPDGPLGHGPDGGRRIGRPTLETAVEAAAFGNAVASLCVEKRGAIPAMPDRAAVTERMERCRQEKQY